MPAGFGIKVFAAGLQHVRELALSPDGILYASVTAEDRLVRLPDANGDGIADSIVTVADGLQGVHGLAFDKNDTLYAATSTSVFRLEGPDSNGKMQNITPIITDLPIQDVPANSTFYVYVERLLLNRPGVMNGYPCGGPGEPCGPGNLPYFRPNNNATRGQTAKIVSNVFYPDCVVPARVTIEDFAYHPDDMTIYGRST